MSNDNHDERGRFAGGQSVSITGGAYKGRTGKIGRKIDDFGKKTKMPAMGVNDEAGRYIVHLDANQGSVGDGHTAVKPEHLKPAVNPHAAAAAKVVKMKTDAAATHGDSVHVEADKRAADPKVVAAAATKLKARQDFIKANGMENADQTTVSRKMKLAAYQKVAKQNRGKALNNIGRPPQRKAAFKTDSQGNFRGKLGTKAHKAFLRDRQVDGGGDSGGYGD